MINKIILIGHTQNGRPVRTDILKNMIVVGQSGSGKSTAIHSLLCELVKGNSPADLKLCLIDLKMIELSRYDTLPHLLGRVATDYSEAINYLRVLNQEMSRRYKLMYEKGVRSIDSLMLPTIICVIDEFADLMLSNRNTVEELMVSLLQKSRACNIFFIIATQSPTAKVLSSLIRANIPNRLALRTATAIDSRIALGRSGCEKLMGNGDAWFKTIDDARIQCPYLSENDIDKVIKGCVKKAVSNV